MSDEEFLLQNAESHDRQARAFQERGSDSLANYYFTRAAEYRHEPHPHSRRTINKMIPTTTPPTTNRQFDTIVAADRVVAGPDQAAHVDRNAAGGTRRFVLDDNPEPLNRRGRRYEQRELHRFGRRASRSLHQQDLALHAAR